MFPRRRHRHRRGSRGVGSVSTFGCHRLSFSIDSVLCGRIKPSGIAVFLSFFLPFSEEKLREENFKRKWPGGEAEGSERRCRNELCKGFFSPARSLPHSLALSAFCKLTLRCQFPYYHSTAAGVKTLATLPTEGETPEKVSLRKPVTGSERCFQPQNMLPECKEP